MAILISSQSRVMVQGITGKSGAMQTKTMLDAGTNIVAGVTPGKGGQVVHGVPVFDSAAEAQAAVGFDTAICFVPPRSAKDSVIEVVDAGAKLLVLTTEEIPAHDVASLLAYAKDHGTTVVGPGCSGIIAPGVCKVGSHPVRFFQKGNVGVVSKSGALSYEVGKTLSEAGIGQSSVIGLGGGPVWGFTQRDAVEAYANDPQTKAIVLLGEIGGSSEEEAAAWIAAHCKKPVVSLIVGQRAPEGRSLGHAGAIIHGKTGTASSKIEALTRAGVHVVNSPDELVQTVRQLLES